VSSSAIPTSTDRYTLLAIVEQRDESSLRARLDDLHPADLADVLESLDDSEGRLWLFRLLLPEVASETIREVNEEARNDIVSHLSDARVTAVIEHLDTDDAADLLGDVPEERLAVLLDRASPEVRRDVEDLLAYPADSAGGIMKTEVAAAVQDATVAEVIDYIRRRADEFHDVHNVFIVDDQNRLQGLVPLRMLLLAEDKDQIQKVMEADHHWVSVDVDQEEVARIFKKYDLLSLPVVDALGCLVGRITIDDIVDVISEEATEDILKMAGIGDESLGKGGALAAMRSRIPWLGLNLITSAASATVVSLFEETIRTAAVAAGLMTIVASLGGNSGVQAMTVTVRGLALGEIRGRGVWKLLVREITAACGNGLILGTTAGTFAYFWKGDVALACVLAVSMLANFLTGALLGTLVPLGLRSLKVDPAVASGVFIQTSTDIVGFWVFLGLLSMVL
jgi:magnesium transporter